MLSRDSRQERKLKLLLRTQFRFKQGLERIDFEEDVLMPIDGCGFGCVLTSVKLLRDIDHEWFSYEKYSEDFDFCLKAQAKGYQLWTDTGVLCGHLPDPKPVTFETFKEVHPELYGGNGNGRTNQVRSGNEGGDLDVRDSEPGQSGEADVPAVEVQPGVL